MKRHIAACWLLLTLLHPLTTNAAPRPAEKSVSASTHTPTSTSASARAAAPEPLKAVEDQLLAADKIWLENSPQQAVPLYDALLKSLPAACEPFRSLIILRQARANYQAGNKPQCIAALDRLAQLSYVPEHHVLAAQELKALCAGKPDPALEKTAIPPLAKPVAAIHARPGAPSGGDGSAARPAAALSEALQLARQARTKNPSGAIEILLDPGVYFVKESLQLSAQDQGLVIRSADPKNPAVLNGAIPLSQWAKPSDDFALRQLPESVRGKVLVCDLKALGIAKLDKLVFGGFASKRVDGGSHRFKTMPVPELFHQGKLQTLARWPDKGLTAIPIDKKPAKPDPRHEKWAAEKELWLYGYWGNDWADAYEKVESIAPDGTIKLLPPKNNYGFKRSQGCVINALCELDQPGEWYLDTAQALVYFLPPKDFAPNQCVLSYYTTPIQAADCPNLQIRDLNIQHIRGDALTFRNCSGLLVANVSIQDCSGLGLRIDGGKQHLVHSCRIDKMGRGGIDILAGNWQKLDPSGSIIENCHISNLSHIDRTYTPALLLEGMGLKVRHNSFVNIPSSAIRVEACDALIELNYFNRCVYESGDQGAIDMWANPLYRGNVIRWNDFDRIVNEVGAKLGAAGVRHDDFICGFMVSENIFRKGSNNGFGCVQYNRGKDNYFEGNLIVDWHKSVTGGSAQGGEWQKIITTHNNSKQMLTETDWKSEAWQKKYPVLRDLFGGSNNHNYLADNQSFGTGKFGTVNGAFTLANRPGDPDFHAPTLTSMQPRIVPWHPIPLDRIGPYQP